ncbi:hypothetical protein KUCAC02_033660 [Chaenocephalus aceratus]|nr:hypothetical protein KUCAC02_033660 [Chaenocephalus aceratus]
MHLPRLSLLLLLVYATRCSAALVLMGSEAQQGVQVVLEGRSALQLSRSPRTRVLSGARSRTHRGPEGTPPPPDPRRKEEFLKHLTGPLHFSPKCRKHFHRLYHNTRDCTTPAYYKRCSRLLTRLANSPRCKDTVS